MNVTAVGHALQKRPCASSTSPVSYTHLDVYKRQVLREKSRLKECYGLRYADDFRIFCRRRHDAEKLFIATRKWLKERLGLDISPEKSQIVNLKRKYSEFLGFKMMVKPNGKMGNKTRYTVVSHISEKRKGKIKKRASELMAKIKFPADKFEEHKFIMDYNSYVMGIHNYYSMATHANQDFSEIGFSLLFPIWTHGPTCWR